MKVETNLYFLPIGRNKISTTAKKTFRKDLHTYIYEIININALYSFFTLILIFLTWIEKQSLSPHLRNFEPWTKLVKFSYFMIYTRGGGGARGGGEDR